MLSKSTGFMIMLIGACMIMLCLYALGIRVIDLEREVKEMKDRVEYLEVEDGVLKRMEQHDEWNKMIGMVTEVIDKDDFVYCINTYAFM
jgi:hypothetical protein